jgi:hypothetical protein
MRWPALLIMDYYGHNAASVAATQARLGSTCPSVSWQGVPRPIIPGSAMRRMDLAVGGFQMNADLRFDALVSRFGTDATGVKNVLLQTPLSYLGDTYKVEGVTILPGGLQISVECNSIFQRA